MDINFFTENLDNPNALIPQILKEWKTRFKQAAFDEYNPQLHKVNNPLHRRDREVKKPDPSGAKDAKTGDPMLMTTWEKVNRIMLPLQKLITSRAKAFLTAGKLTLKAKPEGDGQVKIYQRLQDVFRRNKMQYKNSKIAQAIYSQTECAEIWYTKLNADKTFELRCDIFTPSEGYSLVPVFDNYKDLLAFGLGYETKKDSDNIKHLDIYTKDELRRYISVNGAQWALAPATPEQANPVKNVYGKIPVIYYSELQSIWADVQPLIERLELLISNFGDTNDYNGSPILFAEGEILGFADKGETGKLIEGKQGAKLSYITWEGAPESIKLEIETLIDFIFTGTQTPNISFKEMKGLGDVSGVAYDRIMIDAHLKAKDMQNGTYGEGIQRRINFLITALASLYTDSKDGANLEVSPEFGIFTIDDVADRISNAAKALEGKLIDHQGAITMAGLTDDPAATLTLIENETKAKAPEVVPAGSA